MMPSHRKPLRICTCTRCARPFTDDGAYLRGCCPSCVALVVSCWAEARYRRMLTELATSTAIRGGTTALVTAFDRALAEIRSVDRRAIYLQDPRTRGFALATPSLGAPATLPSFVATALAHCAGPVAIITLAEHDVRLGSLAASAGWSMAIALRGDADAVLGVACIGCAGDTAVTDAEDLAYLATVASAIGAGLAEARALGLVATASPPQPRPRERTSLQRLTWLL